MAKHLPYGRQRIDDDDIAAVVEALRSDFLTTGPQVSAFEREVAAFSGAAHGVAVNSGTAALHAAMHALALGPGDEVLVPAITFAASANCALYVGATPVFCEVDAETLLLDPADAAARITPRTRALIAVDYAGQPCDYAALSELSTRHELALVSDSCHALGARLRGEPLGRHADMAVFSFHPVKHITTGEGGMLVTDDSGLATRARRFRSHGIDADAATRQAQGTFCYDMVELGFNYRLPDIACALGRSQLRKLPGWLETRRALAARYDAALAPIEGVRPLARRPNVDHAYHLYVVRLEPGRTPGRRAVFDRLRAEGVGVNVHYQPVHLHSHYQRVLGTRRGMLPRSEAVYEELLSLPMHVCMEIDDVDRVVDALQRAILGG